jgi:hypothetical protein
MHLNCSWTKSITTFVNKVAHVIRDHKEATQNKQSDDYYLEKLNNTMSEHRDMQAHIQTLDTQDLMLSRRMVGNLAPRTYDLQLFELIQYATILDDQYAKNQANRHANQANQNNGNGGNNGNNGGNRRNNQNQRGNGNGNGKSNGNGSGNGNRNNNNGNRQNNNRGNGNGNSNSNGNRNRQNSNGNNRNLAGPGYISPTEWDNMTSEQRRAIYQERNTACSVQFMDSNSNNPQGGDSANNNGNSNQDSNNRQANNSTGSTQQGPTGVLRNMMSNSTNRSSQGNDSDSVTINGVNYRRANVTYRITQSSINEAEMGSLVDGGANGGLFGDDIKIIEYDPHAQVNVTGLANSQVDNLQIGTGAGVFETVNDGLIIGIMHQYANLGTGKTIHSKGQLEQFGAIVDDTSIPNGGVNASLRPKDTSSLSISVMVYPASICDRQPKRNLIPCLTYCSPVTQRGTRLSLIPNMKFSKIRLWKIPTWLNAAKNVTHVSMISVLSANVGIMTHSLVPKTALLRQILPVLICPKRSMTHEVR